MTFRAIPLLLAAFAMAGASPSPAAERFNLSTSDTHVLVTTAGDRIRVVELDCPSVGYNWAGDGLDMPLMDRAWVGGREVRLRWRYRDANRLRSKSQVVFRFTCASPRMTLWSRWRARPGRGPIEHWVEIRNETRGQVTISQQESLALPGLRVPGAGTTSLLWIKRGGSNATTEGGAFIEPLTPKKTLDLVSNCDDGASPVPWLDVQVGDRQGLYVGWEFSGVGRVHAEVGASANSLSTAVGLNPDFRTDVQPGSIFYVPPAFVGCYGGDADDGSYSLHRFVMEKLRPRVTPGIPDPILAYNLYLDAGGDRATETDVLRCADVCRQIGFEVFMPDAMWFPECGDWRWDPKRFPRGIRPIHDYVHQNGIRQALWCAWTNGGISEAPGALSVRGKAAHPDWFSDTVKPDWKPGPFYGARLCLGCRSAEEWALRETHDLVRDNGLDYLKHDIGPIVTTCDKTDHRHHYGVDVSYWSALGYYEVQEKLLAAFPNLLLENCSGGGHIKDFGVVRRTHYTVTTDTLSNLADRQSIYDSTYALPPAVLMAYTYDNYYPVKGDAPEPFLWRSAMMSAWQIDPTDTAKWTDTQKDFAARSAALYKDWIRPILRDCEVHHVLPRPDGKQWDGLFYWSPPLKRGTLYIFRPDSQERVQSVKLKGLMPGKSYWVWCEDGSVEPGVRSGADLLSSGLSVYLAKPYSSDLIYVRDASLGRPRGTYPPAAFHLGAVQGKVDSGSVGAVMDWSESRGARSYHVVVSANPDMSDPVADVSAIRTTAEATGLPADTRLYWRVEAIGWGGRRWSDGPPGVFLSGKVAQRDTN